MSMHSSAGAPAEVVPSAPAGLVTSSAFHPPVHRETEVVPAARGPRGLAVAQTDSTMQIGLPHIGVVLSVSAAPSDPAADGSADRMPMDPVEHMLHAIAASEGDNGVHPDAIRLAVVVARWLEHVAAPAAQEPTTGVLQRWRLNRVTAHVDDHLGEAISLADLARAAGLTPMYFAGRFRAATGLRPREYLLRRRIERAKDLLARTNDALVDIAFSVGFHTQAHFTTVFKRFAGVTPGQWRRSSRQPA